jgi:hypothetical protein
MLKRVRELNLALVLFCGKFCPQLCTYVTYIKFFLYMVAKAVIAGFLYQALRIIKLFVLNVKLWDPT